MCLHFLRKTNDDGTAVKFTQCQLGYHLTVNREDKAVRQWIDG